VSVVTIAFALVPGVAGWLCLVDLLKILPGTVGPLGRRLSDGFGRPVGAGDQGMEKKSLRRSMDQNGFLEAGAYVLHV
jgi:hypothetical protein